MDVSLRHIEHVFAEDVFTSRAGQATEAKAVDSLFIDLKFEYRIARQPTGKGCMVARKYSGNNCVKRGGEITGLHTASGLHERETDYNLQLVTIAGQFTSHVNTFSIKTC